MSAGILCVSVIEAKNVLAADTASDLSFYVKLRLGHSEVKTDTCMHNIAPKFLKDVRLPVLTPASDVLRIDMLQLGPRGDLVVGSAELLVSSLVNKGTVVHWFELRAFNQSGGAQLCCVLRYLTANANRPVTPSYSIATREARERAVTDRPGTLQAPGPTATRALFSDDGAAPTATAAAGAEQPTAVSAAPPSAPTTPAVNIPTTSRATRALDAHDSPTQSSTGAAPAAATAERGASAPPAAPPSRPAAANGPTSHANGTAAPPSPEAAQPQPRRGVPMPVAMAMGLFLGVFVYILKRRPPQSDACSHDDDVALVSSCFNRSSYERYRQKQWRGRA